MLYAFERKKNSRMNASTALPVSSLRQFVTHESAPATQGLDPLVLLSASSHVLVMRERQRVRLAATVRVRKAARGTIRW